MSWIPDIRNLLPANPTVYRGPRIALILGGLTMTILVVARSFIHLFAPDGGAQSIAGVDTAVTGGSNIVAMFGQWGAIQLLLIVSLLILLIRYRGLLSFVMLVLAGDPPLRWLAGHMKPLTSVHQPPGATLNWWMFAWTLIVLFLGLTNRKVH